MKTFTTTLVLSIALLFSNNLLAQRIHFTTKPSNARLIIEGTSLVAKTSTTKRLHNGGAFLYKEGHLPVYLKHSEMDSRVDIDLVPVRDLIGDKKTKNIAFSKLVLNIPNSKEIGSVGNREVKVVNTAYVQRSLESNLDQWSDLIERELHQRNVQIHLDEVDLFGSHSPKKTENYLLGAEIVNMWISTSLGTSYAFVELRWSLFDKRQKKVVLEVSSHGYGEGVEGKRTHFDLAFANATTHLTCDEEFVNTIMGGADDIDIVEEVGLEPIPVLRISEVNVDMGSTLIKRCIASTVTLVSDKGHGSGVIISEDGMILTNYHVIDESDQVRILFSSGIEMEATVIRSDEHFDVALVKLNSGKGFSALPLGISGDEPAYEVGDDVMAIGTPEYLDLGQTVSRGIVSGNRMAEDRQFIQTDVSINPGNSGGPLINSKGQVIGLVTMKKFDSTGIGFAVPVDQAIEALGITYE